jgi:hypothetical protein
MRPDFKEIEDTDRRVPLNPNTITEADIPAVETYGASNSDSRAEFKTAHLNADASRRAEVIVIRDPDRAVRANGDLVRFYTYVIAENATGRDLHLWRVNLGSGHVDLLA